MELLLPGDRALTPKLVNVRGLHLLDSISAEDYAQVLFGSLAASMTEENLARMKPAGMLQSIRDGIVLHHPDVEASVTHIRLQTQVLRILSLTEAAFAAGVSDSDRFALLLTDQRDGSPIDATEFARRHGVDKVPPHVAEASAESAYERFAEHWRIQRDYERITADGIEQRIRQGLPGPDLPQELPSSDDEIYQTTVDRLTELHQDPVAVAAITAAWLEAIESDEEVT